MICFQLLKMPAQNSFSSANESFVIADSFLTACSQLGKGSGIGWPKWWNQVAHSLYRCLSCYFDKDSHPILWSLVDRASCNVFYTLSHERRCCGFHFHAISPQVLWWGKGGAPLFTVLLLLVLSRADLLVHPAAPLRHRQVGERGGLRKGNTETTAQLSWRIFSSLAYKTFTLPIHEIFHDHHDHCQLELLEWIYWTVTKTKVDIRFVLP